LKTVKKFEFLKTVKNLNFGKSLKTSIKTISNPSQFPFTPQIHITESVQKITFQCISFFSTSIHHNTLTNALKTIILQINKSIVILSGGI